MTYAIFIIGWRKIYYGFTLIKLYKRFSASSKIVYNFILDTYMWHLWDYLTFYANDNGIVYWYI